jgi:chaperonin GroEL
MKVERFDFGDEALLRLARGVNLLAEAVAVTLGPRGRLVVIERNGRVPLVTKDGFAVAKEVELSHPVENIGAQLVNEAAVRQAEVVGDGTTTAIVLSQVLIEEGVKCIVVGMNPVDLKRGIDRAIAAALEALGHMSESCESRAALAQVGTVSANGDPRIGELVAHALLKVGKDGVVTISEGDAVDDRIEVIEGIQFERGYVSPNFVNEELRETSVLENPLVLLSEDKISAVDDLLPAMEHAVRSKRPILVIADDVDGPALVALVSNARSGSLQACAVKAPDFGDARRGRLLDIAALTGAEVLSVKSGTSGAQAALDGLGEARRAEVGRERTLLTGGAGDAGAVDARVRELRAQLALSTSDLEQEALRARLGGLTGGVADLQVGAKSDVEREEKVSRARDALRAARAAWEEGVVPGGGTSLLRAADAVKKIAGENNDQRAGVRMVLRALEEPLRRIAINAGAEPSVVVNRVLAGSGSFGFDATSGEFADLGERGIVDPAKVVRSALRNAASVTGLFLTTSCTLSGSSSRKSS